MSPKIRRHITLTVVQRTILSTTLASIADPVHVQLVTSHEARLTLSWSTSLYNFQLWHTIDERT